VEVDRRQIAAMVLDGLPFVYHDNREATSRQTISERTSAKASPNDDCVAAEMLIGMHRRNRNRCTERQ
jgi:hypothetical protein